VFLANVVAVAVVVVVVTANAKYAIVNNVAVAKAVSVAFQKRANKLSRII